MASASSYLSSLEAEASGRAPPPAYLESSSPPITAGNISTAAQPLNLITLPSCPAPDTCIAHLRLLFTFQHLKNAIGYKNGMWNIWDSRANTTANPADVLARLREKRWALFLARAVDRYEAWWRSFVPDMLAEKDMIASEVTAESKYAGFPTSAPMLWTSDSLPPLDVLLVWHTHMLNPRFFLEDCIRHGYGAFWAAGMPWDIINATIDEMFQYSVSDICKSKWSERTGRAWDNEDDPMDKNISCPACSATLVHPWTTCGQPQDYKGTNRPGLVGEGYGDGKFLCICGACGMRVNHDLLRVIKFRSDVICLVTKDWALPGTILDAKTGMPTLMPAGDNVDRLFPSRLVRRGLLVEMTDHLKEYLKPGSTLQPTMGLIRDMVEKVTAPTSNPEKLNSIESRIGVQRNIPYKLSVAARKQTRTMMARYWQNSSPFALDLCGTVMRQGVFIEKMIKIDWLHSPALEPAMARFLKRYERFVELIAAHPGQAVVPTLDIDLAWHTHQLSPQAYFQFSVKKAGAFTDHDDRVDEDKLGSAFEWTSKTYHERYGEVYSECTCWYCESTRMMHSPPVTKLFGIPKADKATELWHSSGASLQAPQPPRNESAHISAHPAVRMEETISRRAHTRGLRMEYHRRLDAGYEKAIRRVNKSSKKRDHQSERSMGSRGDDKVEYWGVETSVSGPWSSPAAASTTKGIYPTPVGIVPAGLGEPGSCASGTCSGAGAYGSGTEGLCTASCTGRAGGSGCAGGAG